MIETQTLAATACIATNVTVLSIGPPMKAYGITANVWGEELNPGWLLVTLRSDGHFLPALLNGHRFGANVLGSMQQHLALRFAQHASLSDPGIALARSEVVTDAPGIVRLSSSHAWFGCSVVATHSFGRYEIVTAKITAAGLGGEPSPLLFHDGHFGSMKRGDL